MNKFAISLGLHVFLETNSGRGTSLGTKESSKCVRRRFEHQSRFSPTSNGKQQLVAGTARGFQPATRRKSRSEGKLRLKARPSQNKRLRVYHLKIVMPRHGLLLVLERKWLQDKPGLKDTMTGPTKAPPRLPVARMQPAVRKQTLLILSIHQHQALEREPCWA